MQVGGIRSGPPRVIEDRALSEREEAEKLRGLKVSEARYSTRQDPTRVTLLIDDGSKIPSRRELVVTNRDSAEGLGGAFLVSESFRCPTLHR